MRTLLLAAVVLLSCKRGPAPVDVQPERATGCREVEAVRGPGPMVVSAHPEASRIGADILRNGGSAVDAAAAMAVALTLVEPQSSGIGGGAFLLHHDAETGALTAWDGRETAPRAATPALFMGDDGPRGWPDVVPGGLAVGTPGLLRLLEAVHHEQGALPWADLIRPAADLAERGFSVTPRLASSICTWEGAEPTPGCAAQATLPSFLKGIDPLRTNPASFAYFYPDGVAVGSGDRLTNPALAETLRAVAEGGADAFYAGPIAEDIVAAVTGSTRNPGLLSLADLAAYRPVKREPVCLDYRGHRVCGHPPPTSGGTTVLQILGLLEAFEPRAADDPAWAHRFAEAVRVAWADRDRYLADPSFASVPVDAMLADAYLAERAALIGDHRAEAYVPGELPAPARDAPACPEGDDTTHLVVVDADGDVVSMTSSIENAWGSGVMVRGFLLNNQLTDFARAPGAANSPAACKRPRSSMAPIVAYGPDGQVHLALGSPGGSRIIQYVARSLVHVLDHGMDLHAAVGRPNLASGAKLELEEDCGAPAWPAGAVDGLTDRGHAVVRGSLNSGLHGVQITEDGVLGAVDPRREGLAIAVE